MHQQHHSLISASLGTQREIISFHFGEEKYKQVYIQTALHGDEIPGMAVSWYLKQKLMALESAGRLRAGFTLVPVANPLALSQHWQGTHLGRFHSESGQDFNRRFPSLGEKLAAELDGSLTPNESENKRLIRDAIDRHYHDVIARTELEAQRFTLMRMASQADLMIDHQRAASAAEEPAISAEVAAPVIGGDELALVTANAEDIAAPRRERWRRSRYRKRST